MGSVRINWNDSFEDAVAVLKSAKPATRSEAAQILTKQWERSVSVDSLTKAFQSRGFDLATLLGASKEVDPAMLSEDEYTEAVASMIKQCAEQTGMAPQDITWVDFVKFTKYYWGQDEQRLIEPRHITRVGGFANIRDAFFPPESTKFSVERLELAHKAKLHRSVSLIETVNAAFLRQLEEVAERAFGGKITPSKFALKKHDLSAIDRTLVAVWSDLHFHALLDNREVSHRYGPTEEARRFAAVCLQMADWKPHYRDQTHLRILALGDWIQNQLHDMRDGAPLAEQACATIHYVSQALSFLSARFGSIEMLCTPGNHGRFTSRHQTRATLQKWDSLETVIYYGIKTACRHLPNVKIEIPRKPFVTWVGHGGIRGYATHGDTHFNPGFPGSVIKTAQLRDQTNRLNAALPDAQEYKVIVCGHVHTACVLHMDNGTTMVTNGPLIPSDSYAESILIPESRCGQMLFESTAKHAVGDNRLASVGPETDKDGALEAIITPFSDF